MRCIVVKVPTLIEAISEKQRTSLEVTNQEAVIGYMVKREDRMLYVLDFTDYSLK